MNVNCESFSTSYYRKESYFNKEDILIFLSSILKEFEHVV